LKNSNLCDHNSPTSQTDGQTDRQTTCDRNTALCTKVHRAVIMNTLCVKSSRQEQENRHIQIIFLVTSPSPLYPGYFEGQQGIWLLIWSFCFINSILYGAETWSMSVSNTKKLEVAHHRWQRKILKISWNDMITKTARERTGQDRERRLRWFGHTYRMDSNRISRQVMDWTLPHFRRKKGRPRVSWTSTVKKRSGFVGSDMGWSSGSNEGSLGMERLYCPMCFCSTKKD